MYRLKLLKVFSIILILGLGLVLLGQAKQQEKLRFGIDADYPPWTWFEKGEFHGFEVEVLKAIAKHEGLNYEFVALPWETAVPALGAGKIDLLSGGMWITCERDKIIDFTDPYYRENANIVVSKDSDLNMGTALCCGSKLGALAGSTNFEWIKALADNPDSTVTARAYESTLLGIKDLVAGRIDAMHIDTMTAYKFIAAGHDIKLIGEVYMGGETAYGVEEGDPHNLIPLLHEGFKWLWETGQWSKLWSEYMIEGVSPKGPIPLARKTTC